MGKSFVYFFYMDGCGFCEQFESNVWQKLNKSKFPNVKFFKIESEDLQKKEKEYLDEQNKSFKSLLKLNDISGFPEIKIVTPSKKVLAFNGDRSLPSFESWIRSNAVQSGGCSGGGRSKTIKKLKKNVKKPSSTRSLRKLTVNINCEKLHNTSKIKRVRDDIWKQDYLPELHKTLPNKDLIKLAYLKYKENFKKGFLQGCEEKKRNIKLGSLMNSS